VSQQDSSMIEKAKVPRSKFLNSWTRKTAFDAGKLYPILVDEVLPGDHLTYDVTAYVRMSTAIYPMMDQQRIDTHFFFVPSRLLWTNWVKMMGEQDQPGDTIAYTTPQVATEPGGFALGSLGDHFGLPAIGQPVGGGYDYVTSLPFRAYNLIYNQWFRDENVMPATPIHTDNGPDVLTDYAIMPRAKSHDYFTSCLPWPQKFTAPTVPLAGLAPIVGLGVPYAGGTTAGPYSVKETAGTTNYDYYSSAAGVIHSTNTGAPLIYADLSASAGVAINILRQAFLVQELLERDARGGTRYTELIRSHFGVVSPDFRLQRPEYIGGGQSPLNITPIAQTALGGAGLGTLAGAGTAAGTHHASYAATEHGYILALLSVKTELSYSQGLHKMWKRQTRFDYYWPTLAALGEQAVLMYELYHKMAGGGLDIVVFGYQERWQEYRTKYSDITGVMRPYATGTLGAWHLSQLFTAPPALNAAFLTENPPMSRILAAGTLAANQQYIADIMYKRTAVRPIPTYGTPVTLGRF
jgi:hypothetical protein